MKKNEVKKGMLVCKKKGFPGLTYRFISDEANWEIDAIRGNPVQRPEYRKALIQVVDFINGRWLTRNKTQIPISLQSIVPWDPADEGREQAGDDPPAKR